MSKVVKTSQVIKNYILQRKRKNAFLGCRQLALETGKKFNINMSKSSVNSIIKDAKLSSSVGRKVSSVFRPNGACDGAGFSLLLGANHLLGLTKIMASAIKKVYPEIKLKDSTLAAVSEAWLMSKAIYNVPLEKIENYNKNDLWFIIGKKINKGVLKHYVESLKFPQHIGLQLVSEFSHILQDAHYVRVILADDSQYFFDGQLKSIWPDKKISIDFCATLVTANSYINNCFYNFDPFYLFNTRPDSALGEEFSDFVFSFDGASSEKRIRKIEIIALGGNVSKEIPFVLPGRRRFAVGIWPWQYEPIAELEKQNAQRKCHLEASGKTLYFVEKTIKFVQHVLNIEVALRLIVLKVAPIGPALVGIMTNLGPDEWSAEQIAENYLRRYPDIEAGRKLFLSVTKTPSYFEEFISSDKLLMKVQGLRDATDSDRLFSILVEILNVFCQRSFFPARCASWSLPKMRELFYKHRGVIKRDMADDVIFNLFNSNVLEEKEILEFVATKFNEASAVDDSGRKLWFVPVG